MLSVLIPTYNYNVLLLVKELYEQLEKEGCLFEIIVIDDASSDLGLQAKNVKINQLDKSSFTILEKNIGRSSIRNLLASKANFDWLLFLDSDVLPKCSKFISNYISAIKDYSYIKVFQGGCFYDPDFKNNRLRWKIGKNGEERIALERNKKPYSFFLGSNFLIKKEIFTSVRFDEDIKHYGYEDSLFSKELEKNTVKLLHLDNEVIHLGIDDNVIYLKKTKEALSNLVNLIKSGRVSFDETKISTLYKTLKITFIPNILRKNMLFLERKAISKSSLFYYNLFRIGYLHKVFEELK